MQSLGPRIGRNVYAGLPQRFQSLFADHRVEALQNRLAADEERRLRTQMGEDSGQFHGDVATSDDGDPPGLLVELEKPVRGDP